MLNKLILLLLAGLTGLAFVYGHDVSHFFFWLVGSRDEPGAWYGFWSGFGGSIPDIAIFTGGTAWWFNHTCHAHPTCLRWGKFQAAGGTFKLCHRHHPDLKGESPHIHLIRNLHQEYKENP